MAVGTILGGRGEGRVVGVSVGAESEGMAVGGRGELAGSASPGEGTAFPQAVIKRASVKRVGKNRKALRDVLFSIITILLILSLISR